MAKIEFKSELTQSYILRKTKYELARWILEDARTLENHQRLRPEARWREQDGPVLWWRLPIDEPPYVGTPLDATWPGYHTHWTRIPMPFPDAES